MEDSIYVITEKLVFGVNVIILMATKAGVSDRGCLSMENSLLKNVCVRSVCVCAWCVCEVCHMFGFH